ncbi:hypothetical protein [Enterovirga rhinocerotis]|uniref:Uncharacterized protein n=1 Tax=Enterovirga rhinocerotis TaxID=1339210 RepID=A0A4V6PZI8_9HYPH|nr:hypothetical protein [Enterovirga rhinocerotis]TDR89659.1 hypothetical protein EV668_2494 [Enterovirga rhinocerotis]
MDQQQSWSLEAVAQLREMAKERIPVETMSLKLKRPVDQVRTKLGEIGITPTRDSDDDGA